MNPIDFTTERERYAHVKGNCVVVCNRYDIPLDRCSTKIEAYQWLVHLLEKNWITREALFDLVDVLQRHFGYNLHDAEGNG